MTKHLLLVEDEPLAQARISTIIRKHRPDWVVADTVQSISELEQALKNQAIFDLILCDIHLADGLSFRAFQNKKIKIPIIFITAYDEYALQSFEHNCIDYVLKPIQEERLIKAFEKVESLSQSPVSEGFSSEFVDKFIQRYTQKTFKRRFLTKTGTKLSFTSVEEIAFFYAEGGVTFLVTSNSSQKFMIDHSLNELETELLDPNKFYRINRSFIINLDNLLEMKPYHNGRLVLSLNAKSEEVIVVARERVNEFKSWIDQ
ncbi:MAG: LytTR family DNA-binding domain-containing protein [Algoriphagus sp.]|uniref:LytR/AlgR family response regulator transcription factor n=1 Tax=Algoriphagus sp. TaxID=1872435 RepID=UPI00272F79DE|nr:LytTR family DNA-binding domain-containing protein [Algoriphagus sp.]MDP2039921.1 LytTR family DNA-binding domain-containing protein [Algoriphagus sp.]MDP3471655.1 LytTR family DNA-binding domain-containing protein [Algoriphagus sp.]